MFTFDSHCDVKKIKHLAQVQLKSSNFFTDDNCWKLNTQICLWLNIKKIQAYVCVCELITKSQLCQSSRSRLILSIKSDSNIKMESINLKSCTSNSAILLLTPTK